MRTATRRASPTVRFARWAGVAYTAASIVGFALTGFHDPLRRSGEQLLLLEVNPLLNLVHLLVGLGLLAASAAGPESARIVSLLVAAAFGVTGLLGLALVGTAANVLALNHADNLVHLATAGLATACVASSTRTSTASAAERAGPRTS